MAILYIVTVLVLIVTNIEKLPGALATIVEYAFGVKSSGRWCIVFNSNINAERYCKRYFL